MKKKYVFVFLSVFIFVIAGLLMINKVSYSEPYPICDDSYNVVYTTNKMNEFISNDKNMIKLPQNMFLLGEARSFGSGFTYATNAELLYPFVLNPGYNPVYRIDYSSNNYEIGYLIKNMDLGFNESEERYYKQILLLWIRDVVEGFDDNYNYYYDDYVGEMKKLPVEENYEDKFDSEGWIFENSLSAGDKQMIKESEVGDTLTKALKDYFTFVEWIRSEPTEAALNSISSDEIYYYTDNKYLETNLIYPSAEGKPYKYLFEKYKVKVNSPAVIVDSNGKVKDVFNSDEGFKVRIPIESIKDKSFKFDIDIVGELKLYDMSIYDGMLEGRIQYSAPNPFWYLYNNYISEDCYSSEEQYTDLSFGIEDSVGNLNIKVIDTSNGSYLEDAEVVVEDENGNVSYRKTTSDKELNITLPVGNYLVKQTITPPNYEAITIQKRVSVSEDEESEVVLENALVVSVPDTLGSAVIYTVIGGLIIVAGGIVLVEVFRKKKVSR